MKNARSLVDVHTQTTLTNDVVAFHTQVKTNKKAEPTYSNVC